MRAPHGRGPLSSAIIDTITGREIAADLAETARAAVSATDDILSDDDIQCALYVLYELHYTGIDGVDDAWEWDAGLLETRAVLEAAFEAALRVRVPVPNPPAPTAEAVAEALFALTAPDSGPSLSRTFAKKATDAHAHEFLIQRSIYTLKEADPHTWAIPRISGRAKAALVEVQSDEYGGGHPHRMHAAMFARTMRGLGLDDTYGAYADVVPAITLASLNMMSLFGLHRRLRGAICGHLAAFEMTSSLPNRSYGDGFRRLGYGEDVTAYFDEHVEADAVHEQIAGRDLAGGLIEAEPQLLDDVLFGAAACLMVDGLAADHMRLSWESGASSLRQPLVSA